MRIVNEEFLHVRLVFAQRTELVEARVAEFLVKPTDAAASQAYARVFAEFGVVKQPEMQLHAAATNDQLGRLVIRHPLEPELVAIECKRDLQVQRRQDRQNLHQTVVAYRRICG